jgi:hypothetical protein
VGSILWIQVGGPTPHEKGPEMSLYSFFQDVQDGEFCLLLPLPDVLDTSEVIQPDVSCNTITLMSAQRI